ncbi:MAG: periplasmic heavy metal sensor [Bacteroidetes bacterium]|nr:periplasmic heavy metal sensor [Bacteroidota bacterium]
MNRSSLLTTAVVVLMVMNIALIIFMFVTKPPHPEGPGGPGRPKQIIIERLRLDREQVERYEALIEQHRNTIRETSERVEGVRRELYATLSSPDAAKEDSLTAVLGTLLQSIERAHFDHVLAVKGLCRPDQMKEFDAFSRELVELFSPKEQRRR